MSSSFRFPGLRRPSYPPPYYGRATAADAHGRLDAVEAQMENLVLAVESAATGQSELAKSVNELTSSVAVLRGVTTDTQASLKTYLTTDEKGRETLVQMISDVFDKKTGGWLRLAVIAGVASAGGWVVPRFLEVARAMFHG